MRFTRAIKLEMDGQGTGCLLILTTNELLMTLDVDRWHLLPRNGAIQDCWDHSGFACVCVSSCLLVIRGCNVSSFPYEEHVVVY